MAENLYMNGEVIPADQAHLPIDDIGFLHGGSIFSTLAAFNGKAFRLDRHLARLDRTSREMDLKVDFDAEDLTGAVDQLLKVNQLTRARIRITLSPGSLRDEQGTTLVTASPLPEYPPPWYLEGVLVAISPYRQQVGEPTYGRKTGCYLPRIMARKAAHDLGAVEALWFTPMGRLAEGCFTNVFLVKDGVLQTPGLDTPVLDGVTRQTVLELAEQLGITAQAENELTVEDMLAAQEIFLTASTMGLVPVAAVEKHVVGQGKPGPITRRLTEAYNDLIEQETGPAGRPDQEQL